MFFGRDERSHIFQSQSGFVVEKDVTLAGLAMPPIRQIVRIEIENVKQNGVAGIEQLPIVG